MNILKAIFKLLASFFDISEELETQDWRKRFTVKQGVDASKFEKEITDILNLVADVFEKHLEGLKKSEEDILKPRITSSYEKAKGRLKNSYHYLNIATDFGFWVWRGKKRVYIPDEILDKIEVDIRERTRKVSPYYDLVKKRNHFHLEFDMRRALKNEKDKEVRADLERRYNELSKRKLQ